MPDPPNNPLNPSKDLPLSSTIASGSLSRNKLPLHDYLKGVIQLQHSSIDQANMDRHAMNEYHKANKARHQKDPVEAPNRLEPGHIDLRLQRFRADGPPHTGPPQVVEPFITGLQGVELLFTTSGFPYDDDKICVAGKLIREGNTQAFYAQEINSLLGKSWSNFRTKLMTFALPRHGAQSFASNFRTCRCLDQSPFLSTTLGAAPESMTSGVGDLLHTDVNNHQLLLQNPCDYTTFKSRASLFWDGIVLKRAAARTRANPSTTQSSTQLPLQSKEENIWRVHTYLDSEGLCRFCKKKCGSAPGLCSGQMDRKFVPIPAMFVAPPMPADWKPPVNRASAPSSAGKPTRPPAGQGATVAGISNKDTEQNLDQASLLAISALDEELCLAIADQYVQQWASTLTVLLV
ncbi:hypothetical protein PSTG_00443 [Puccinia striiformis f. sp. tritici PST-78]|uniref:Uncharacterized protein n=1 Tax=Puccinia striiformis f. sp. tritici PST-78 TaxID=1165861 RepID=A0A0L0W5P3_9BASI|nr:hypothetical protein PSTG_00443 [Puccinia striiformis f. sp. tritici PST-78]